MAENSKMWKPCLISRILTCTHCRPFLSVFSKSLSPFFRKQCHTSGRKFLGRNLQGSWPAWLGRVIKQKEERQKKRRKTIIWRRKTRLTKVLYLALSRSTTTYSIRSRCSSFVPNTIRFSAELVCNSPVWKSQINGSRLRSPHPPFSGKFGMVAGSIHIGKRKKFSPPPMLMMKII